MKVILRKDVPELGKAGDIKEVKNGYALNYLIPRGYAYIATEENLKKLEEEKRVSIKKEERIRKQYEELKTKIESITCTISAKAGKEDKLYGAVTAQDIVENLKKLGINIDKRQLELNEPIKKIGVYYVPIKLGFNIKCELKVWVVRS